MRRSVLGLLCVVVVATPWPSVADTTSWGCLTCIEKTLITFPRDYCLQVGDGESGYTSCTESTFGLYQYCNTGGSPCYNVTVTSGGGGGGGGTGGGGSTGGCTIRHGEACPASCMSCTINLY